MNICVFCSSSQTVDQIFFNEARQLGQLIAQNKHQLVYGGAHLGLMGEVAHSVKKHKGKVIGVMPEKLINMERANYDSDKFIKTVNMYDRKKTMADLAEAFIALPGGFGTLEETFEVLTLKQLGYHNKAIVLINTDGFYDDLKQLIDSVIQKNLQANPLKLFIKLLIQVMKQSAISIITHEL